MTITVATITVVVVVVAAVVQFVYLCACPYKRAFNRQEI
jgi:hypothetical protein